MPSRSSIRPPVYDVSAAVPHVVDVADNVLNGDPLR